MCKHAMCCWANCEVHAFIYPMIYEHSVCHHQIIKHKTMLYCNFAFPDRTQMFSIICHPLSSTYNFCRTSHLVPSKLTDRWLISTLLAKLAHVDLCTLRVACHGWSQKPLNWKNHVPIQHYSLSNHLPSSIAKDYFGSYFLTSKMDEK